MVSGGQRGPKPLTARDWLFGSRPRRLALRFVLNTAAPKEGWSKSDLALHCQVSKHGGISGHVDGLVALGLLKEVGDRFRPDRSRKKLRAHLNALLDELEGIPDESLEQVLLRRAQAKSE
jgi:hypothetical protein